MAKGAICGSIFAFKLSVNNVFTPHGLLVAKKKKEEKRKGLKRNKEKSRLATKNTKI